jgi:uncharacterized protein YhfF
MPKLIYEIEQDERDRGGTLQVVATYEDQASAMVAWSQVKVPEDDQVQMWLVLRGGPIDQVIDVKCK